MTAVRKVQEDDLTFILENCYSEEQLSKCRLMFQKNKLEGKIKGNFEDDYWNLYSGVTHCGIRFSINSKLYESHGFKYTKLSVTQIKERLKCYVMSIWGTYMFLTVKMKIHNIIYFLQNIGEKPYEVSDMEAVEVERFLGYIRLPDEVLQEMISLLPRKKAGQKKQRKLSHLINYLVISEEINKLFKIGTTEEKIKYFPVYFWTNITFILPLRATEMLLTPFDCIKKEGDDYILYVRRTILKKGKRTVYYDVNKDYKFYEYKIPDGNVVQSIIEYQKLTEGHQRKYLFEYSDRSINNMLSLDVFNELLEEFILFYVIGNRNYDFVKYATGIEEFEIVSAGDSRHIAMSNLYFQNAGADICRQLAGHMNIDISSGYYTNISDTLMCSSIMQLQRKMEGQRSSWSKGIYTGEDLLEDDSKCTSPKRINDKQNIDDCIAQKHLENCFGCRYYRPSKKEVEEYYAQYKKELDENSKNLIKYLDNMVKVKNQSMEFNKLFLEVQNNAAKYKEVCDIKSEEVCKEWQEMQSTMKKDY